MTYSRAIKTYLGAVLLGILTIISACGTHQEVRTATATAVEAPRCGGDECFDVDIGPLSHHLRDMSSKEVADQLRDWAVYGTLVHLGVDGDTLGKATFKTAPVRLPYLEEAFPFEYGRGRRAFVGEKDVLLFYEKDDRDPAATLGRLADRVRMEMGEIPAAFQVYAIAPDLAGSTIHVERRPPIAGAALFGPAYGYVERAVGSLDELTAWLGAIDDVTFAAVRDGRLLLGGRRLEKSRTRGVTVDDVAALWQAQKELAAAAPKYEAERKKAEALLEKIKEGIRARLRSRQGAAPALVTDEPERLPFELGDPELIEEFSRVAAALRPVPEAPGFSLDPQWNPRGLAETLEAIAARPCLVFEEAREIVRETAAVPDDAKPFLLRVAETLAALRLSEADCAKVWIGYGDELGTMAVDVRRASGEKDPIRRAAALDRAMLALRRLPQVARESRDSGSSTEVVLNAIQQYVEARHQFQCARYDGPLAGTRVGMNLFYTDLLAKLWESTDYHHSAPATQVPGFLSAPRLNIDPIWAEEVEKLPSTRIWFGLRPEGTAISGAGDELWFSHIATRVFAAGSNPANPSAEEQPGEDSRQTIGWWDRHFADVADYEQQYHVQNQIIKWSHIVGFKSDVLRFLEGVSVRRDDRFDRWYAREKQSLRYRHPIALRPEADWVTGTECVDTLSSYLHSSYGSIRMIWGGVSLPGKEALKAAPRIARTAPPSLRLQPAVTSGPGTATRVLPVYEGPGAASIKVPPAARLRDGSAELALGDLKLGFSSGPSKPATIALSSKEAPIGSLVGEARSGQWVSLQWRADVGVQAKNLAQAGARDASLGTAQRALVRVEGSSPRVLVLAREREVALELQAVKAGASEGALARAPVLRGVKVELAVQPKTAPELASELDRYPWQRVSPAKGQGVRDIPTSVERSFVTQGPPSGARSVTLNGVDGFPEGLPMHLADDGAIYIQRPATDAARVAWRDLDVRARLTSKSLAALDARAGKGATTVTLDELSSPAVERSFELARQGDHAGALRGLREASGGDAARLSDNLRRLEAKAIDSADDLLARGNGHEASELYRLAEQARGSASPEIQLRRGLAEIASGQPGRGISRVGDLRSAPPDLAFKLLPRTEDVRGLEGVRDLLTARSNPSHTVFGRPANELFLAVDGVDAKSAFRLEGFLPGQRVPVQARGKLAGGKDDVAIYIDDRFSLNRHDFKMSSEGTLAELARSPKVEWKVVNMAGERYQPGIIVEGGTSTRYRQMAAIDHAAGQQLAPGTRAIFIRYRPGRDGQCDNDNDGVVSDAERRACDARCDNDNDGVVSDAERRACNAR
ncbi:hypothetical protein [Sorangium sp. So ce1389]|uniref:hypothetical protein n=1 Tax=Sorangium sp. So ce1389 TaxID=3133336 RepID=UPI003F61BB3A